MGLSWAHFLTMVFLALSFIVALVALILRYRRTKELLRLILKEESMNDREG
jgi:thiosulfate reductase cytochrome b subunit